MSAPKRIQRKREKGWRMPPDTVYVGRPSKWGNPWSLYDEEIQDYPFDSRRLIVVRYFAKWLTGRAFAGEQNLNKRKAEILQSLRELRGKDLACWCPLDKPCHADVLLKLANAD